MNDRKCFLLKYRGLLFVFCSFWSHNGTELYTVSRIQMCFPRKGKGSKDTESRQGKAGKALAFICGKIPPLHIFVNKIIPRPLVHFQTQQNVRPVELTFAKQIEIWQLNL